jgi:hypothetical protein
MKKVKKISGKKIAIGLGSTFGTVVLAGGAVGI